jgi:uncharacterized Zn finger protein
VSPGRSVFGLTWWGQRWIGALEALGALYANRLPRGRTYARRGAVTDQTVGPGLVTARVQGSRARPYRVELRLPAFGETTWDAVTVALAGQLRHAAALLDGRMPEDVDEVLAGCGVSLFPRAGELATSCSCPDWANPCKHVAAVHYTLAQAFDADPFLLPELRGRGRAALLGGLRAVRAGVASVEDDDRAVGDETLALASLSASALWTGGADLSTIAVHPSPLTDPGVVVRRLGPPPGCSPAEAASLEVLVADAAGLAWRLATGGDDGGDGDDPLLAAVRRQGRTTSRELADALGLTPAAVRARLAGLVDAGLVRRAGHGPATRYEG